MSIRPVAFCFALAVGALPPSIVLERHCDSDLGTSRLTLFDRGGVRVATEAPGEAPVVAVRELSSDDLAAFLRRIHAIDLTEVRALEDTGRGAEGEWVDACQLVLQLPGTPSRSFGWRPWDTLPLQLAALLRVVDELGVGAQRLDEGHLPRDYQPAPGDILRRADGNRFRIVGATGDLGGLELQGIDEPIVIYVGKGSLASEFVELVERAKPLR